MKRAEMLPALSVSRGTSGHSSVMELLEPL